MWGLVFQIVLLNVLFATWEGTIWCKQHNAKWHQWGCGHGWPLGWANCRSCAQVCWDLSSQHLHMERQSVNCLNADILPVLTEGGWGVWHGILLRIFRVIFGFWTLEVKCPHFNERINLLGSVTPFPVRRIVSAVLHFIRFKWLVWKPEVSGSVTREASKLHDFSCLRGLIISLYVPVSSALKLQDVGRAFSVKAAPPKYNDLAYFPVTNCKRCSPYIFLRPDLKCSIVCSIVFNCECIILIPLF